MISLQTKNKMIFSNIALDVTCAQQEGTIFDKVLGFTTVP